LINFCLKALLKADVPTPELNHLLEAAAFYPFAYLQEMIEEEIDRQLDDEKNGNELDDYTYFYRQMAWEAYEKLVLPSLSEDEGFEDDYIFDLEKYYSKDKDDWQMALDCIADGIFWDRDWEFVSLEPQLLDGMDPMIAYNLGISENYFTNRLPKVTDEEAIEALREIMEWTLS